MELQGCHSEGDTEAQALESLGEAIELWLETALEDGVFIPEPRVYSDNLLLYLPAPLRQKLASEADREGISFNQYAVHKLSAVN